MRIAIYHNLPSGGGKRALYEMTRRLASMHTIDVYSLSTAEHNFCDIRAHCNSHVVVPFRPLPIARRPFGRLNQVMRSADLARLEIIQRHIGALIDQGDYDIVFVHPCKFSQSPGLLKYLETPSAYYCQEPPRLVYEPPPKRATKHLSGAHRLVNLIDPLPRMYRATIRHLDRKNVWAASKVLANSHYSRETLYRIYGILADVCYLGVDTSVFRPTGQAREQFVLSVGQLSPSKGFDFVIRSLALIESSHRPELVLVSNLIIAEEQQYLQSLADSCCVSVTFRVRISNEELVSLYSRAALTLYAPVMEPFGLVPLESMACGTAVVGVREAGVRESILNQVTGILSERNEAEYASAIEELMRDARKRESIMTSCRQNVLSNWSWDRTVVNLERIFDAIRLTHR